MFPDRSPPSTSAPVVPVNNPVFKIKSPPLSRLGNCPREKKRGVKTIQGVCARARMLRFVPPPDRAGDPRARGVTKHEWLRGWMMY